MNSDGILFVFLICLIIILSIILSIISKKYIFIIKQIEYMEKTLKHVLEGNNNLYLFTYDGETTEELSVLINQLMDSYKKERTKAKREQDSQKRLISDTSHDIRTPLSSVIGYIEAIKLGILNEDEKNNYLQIALNKSYDLKQKVEQLFELVRLDANEIQFKIEKVEACELIRSMVIDFIPIVERQNIDMQVSIPEEEYYINIDIEAFIRVIQNLIRNAVTHGISGLYLGINVYLSDSDVNIDIIDHGEGIKKKDMDFIFDRLYQGDSSRTKNGGLGLAITHELIKKMGGNITVKSEELKYTIFNIKIPLLC